MKMKISNIALLSLSFLNFAAHAEYGLKIVFKEEARGAETEHAMCAQAE